MEKLDAGRVRQACDQGDLESCLELAHLHRHGLLVKRDAVRAKELYGQACDGGLAAAACYHLGRLLYLGDGVPADKVAAARAFERGCDESDAEACVVLGQLYEFGEGVEADDERAAELYTHACDDRAWDACYHLGRLYFAGRGVERDTGKAAWLLEEACRRGVEDACAD